MVTMKKWKITVLFKIHFHQFLSVSPNSSSNFHRYARFSSLPCRAFLYVFSISYGPNDLQKVKVIISKM